jgi:hypothetical protein
MAIVSMTKRDSYIQGYYYSETIADGETGDDIKVFPLGMDGADIGVMIIAGANSGKAQFSMSSDAEIAAGTAVWSDWPKGAVTGTDWDTVKRVTGLRGVSVSGEITIKVVI